MEMTKANKQRLIFGPILLIVGVVLLILWKMKEYFGLLKMTVEKVLSFIILVMIGTLILFYAYFARKGDLE